MDCYVFFGHYLFCASGRLGQAQEISFYLVRVDAHRPPGRSGEIVTSLSIGHLLTATSMASHQGSAHVGDHRIAHDFLGAAVQDGRKTDEPGPRADVGDIPAQLTSW